MAYVDLAATQARGMYSPPNGNHPQVLPDSWRESLPDGTIRTDLPDLTDEELNAIGWKGPITMPPYSTSKYGHIERLGRFTHNYEWNSETREYDVTELTDYEKQNRVEYKNFWDSLLSTSAYTVIKLASSQSLEANTLVTEFIALMSDAKTGQANIKKIQQILTEIISHIPLTPEELEEIQKAFIESGMSAVYTLQ
jgi:hypothetical protein